MYASIRHAALIAASALPAQQLQPSAQFAGTVDVATAAVHSADSGTLSLTSLPAGATILQAFYYFVTIDNAVATANTFAGVSLPIVPIGMEVGTTTSRNARCYRNDVTALVGGNGSYAFARSAGGSSRGAVLLVVYDDPTIVTNRQLLLHDGIDGGASSDGTTCAWSPPVTFAFPAAASTPHAEVLYAVQGGSAGFTENYRFGADGGAMTVITDNDPATQSMEVDRYDVSSLFAGGETSAQATCCELTDAILWIAAVLRVEVDCVTAGVTPLGVGCGAQPPTLLPVGTSLPQVGTTFAATLASPGTPGQFAIVIAGTSTSFHAGLGVPLPFDLGIFGLTGCHLRCSSDLAAFGALLDPQGDWTLQLPVPAGSSLCGLPVCLQGSTLMPGTTWLSNGLRCIVGI